jgi:hypothetical protein
MKTIVSLASAALCCLLFASCDYLKNPLSKPEESQADQRLEGKWLAKDANGSGEGRMVPVGGKLPDCVMEFFEPEIAAAKIVGPPEKNDDDGQNHTLFFPTQVGDRGFLNVFFVNDKTYRELKEQGWKTDIGLSFMIFRYKIDGDRLTVWDVADDSLKKAVEGGKIKGSITKNKVSTVYILFFFPIPIYNEELTISDSPENVRQFFGGLDESHFEELLTITKVLP